jgi:transcriptional regulatory protein LEU3
MKEIAHCCRYYRDFHPQLPILDPLGSADDLYGYYPLLFWIVLSLGARKYDKHPTLIHALSPRVTNHVMMSMNPRNVPIGIIKALVLFLTWPFPSNSFYRTSPFILSATLIHMAMQRGLHTPYLHSEPLRQGLESLEIGNVEGAKLWSYTVITYQRYGNYLVARL